jgi:molybdopterin adenylyltransferase
MSVTEHRERARQSGSVWGVAIVTTTDSRTDADDLSGALCAELVQAAGLRVAARRLVANEVERIRSEVHALLAMAEVDAILVLGGTGLGPRDVSVEAVNKVCELGLPGFGELFRMLSFAEIGAAAMLSRATAGVAWGKALFVMPGSPAAVRMAMERLILPELDHLLAQVRAS